MAAALSSRSMKRSNRKSGNEEMPLSPKKVTRSSSRSSSSSLQTKVPMYIPNIHPEQDRAFELRQYSSESVNRYCKAYRKDPKILERLARRVRNRVEGDSSGFVSFCEKRSKKLQKKEEYKSPECVSRGDLVVGACLGQGSFSSVFLLDQYTKEDPAQHRNEYTSGGSRTPSKGDPPVSNRSGQGRPFRICNKSLCDNSSHSSQVQPNSDREDFGGTYMMPLEGEKTRDISYAGTATTRSISTHSSLGDDGDDSSLHSVPDETASEISRMISNQNVVVKILQPKLMNQPKLFANCVAGLIREGMFLAALDHPNVLKVHAWTSPTGWKDFPALSKLDGKLFDGYVLILERLKGGTLKRWMRRWNLEHQKERRSIADMVVMEVMAAQHEQQLVLGKDSHNSSSTSSGSKWRRTIFGTKKKCSQKERQSVPEDLSRYKDSVFDKTRMIHPDGHPYPRRCPTTQLADRIHLVTQLSDTVKYLAKHRILHRDLKPDNIGVTYVQPDNGGETSPSRLALKIFDFDIARLVPKGDDGAVVTRSKGPSMSHSARLVKRTPTAESMSLGRSSSVHTRASSSCTNDPLFKMTGNMGSPRYMAPEIARREKYNLRSEVYTVCVLVHEVLTLQRPYDELQPEHHSQLVHNDAPGYRPPIRDSWGWPVELRHILKTGWGDIRQRPSIKELHAVLKKCLPELLEKTSSGVTKTNPTMEPRPEPRSCKPCSGTKQARSLFSRKLSKKKESFSSTSTSPDSDIMVAAD